MPTASSHLSNWYLPALADSYSLPMYIYIYQGGNFNLKVGGEGGGAKSSGNAGDPMLGVAVNP